MKIYLLVEAKQIMKHVNFVFKKKKNNPYYKKDKGCYTYLSKQNSTSTKKPTLQCTSHS